MADAFEMTPPLIEDPTGAELLQRAMAAASNGIVIADATREDCPIIYINAGFERLSGYCYEDIMGRNCRFLQGPDTDPASVRKLGEAVRDGTERRVTLLNYRKDGAPFWNELFLAPVHDADGRLVQYVGVQNDVTERRRAEEQVAHMAYHDALTGLANRAKLEAGLQRALRDANQRKLSLALLYLDLDDFKSVNDGLGPGAGDDLLREAARRLRAVCRPSDLLARQGGDEFLILLDALEEEPEKTAGAVAELPPGRWASRSTWKARRSPWVPAWVCRCFPATRGTPTACSSTRTRRCTRPRATGAGACRSTWTTTPPQSAGRA